MTFIASDDKLGILPLQDHGWDKGPAAVPLDYRRVLYATRVNHVNSSHPLRPIFLDEDSHGDIVGSVMWEPISEFNRPVSAWSFAMPVEAYSPGTASVSTLPIRRARGSDIDIDGRFWILDAAPLEGVTVGPTVRRTNHRQFPGSTAGLVVGAVNEQRQDPVFLSCDSRLIADWRGPTRSDAARRFRHSSIVYDVDIGGFHSLSAPLHSAWRVSYTSPLDSETVLAWNLTRCPAGDRAGNAHGLVYSHAINTTKFTDKKFVTTTGPTKDPRALDRASGSFGDTFDQSPPKDGSDWGAKLAAGPAVCAYMSTLHGGPLHVGDTDDQHRIDMGPDAVPINAGHIGVNALFYFDRKRDGPLEWRVNSSYPGATVRPETVEVHLVWDDSASHPWIASVADGYAENDIRTGRGAWRWYSHCVCSGPDDGDGGGDDPTGKNPPDKPKNKDGGGGGREAKPRLVQSLFDLLRERVEKIVLKNALEDRERQRRRQRSGDVSLTENHPLRVWQEKRDAIMEAIEKSKDGRGPINSNFMELLKAKDDRGPINSNFMEQMRGQQSNQQSPAKSEVYTTSDFWETTLSPGQEGSGLAGLEMTKSQQKYFEHLVFARVDKTRRRRQVRGSETVNEMVVPSMGFYPQKPWKGGVHLDLRYAPEISDEHRKENNKAPMVLRIDTFGAVSDNTGAYTYATKAPLSRYQRGSGQGGILIGPPEQGVEDARGELTVNNGSPRLTHTNPYVVLRQTCLAFADLVLTDQGVPADGYVMAKLEGNLVLVALDDAATQTPVTKVYPTGHFQHETSTGHPTREVNNFGFLTSTSLTEGDHTLIVDTSLAAVPYDVNLPAVADYQNIVFQIKRFLATPGGAARRVRINPQVGEQIDNLGAGVSLDLTSAGQSVTLKATGSQWHSF